MKKTFIYGLVDPITGLLRYVGKSNNPQLRLRVHISHSRFETNHKSRWIQHLLKNGLRPQMLILDEVPDSEWQQYEQDWIACFGDILTNATKGGDGGLAPSDETRLKMSLKKRGNTINAGRYPSQETRHKQSISAIKRWLAKPESEKMRQIQRLTAPPRPPGWKHTEEAKRKISEAGLGRQTNARLNKDEVLTIVDLINGGVALTQIAQMFNVAISIVSNIKYGECYSNWTGIKRHRKRDGASKNRNVTRK